MFDFIASKVKGLLIKFIMKLSPLFGDVFYTKILFRLRAGYRLNLNNPQTFNEKLQWLKLNYQTDEQTKLVDKFLVKEIVGKIIGEKYIIPNLGVWNSVNEINLDDLPNKFVLKTTHDQGGVVVCKDKSSFKFIEAKEKLQKHLNKNFYLKFREWPYKNVKPRIIAEKFIGNANSDLKDYKFYCFDGKVKILFIASGRGTEDKSFDFYDVNFKHLNIKRPKTINSKMGNKKPKNYDKMISFAEQLSGNFPHVRVDFYNIDGIIYFGEITFFTGGGMKPFIPKKWDYILGEYINLSKNKLL